MQAALVTCCAALALALAGGCATATPPAAVPSKSLKREGPAAVAPVRVGTMEISVVHWGTSRGLAPSGGYIVALLAVSLPESPNQRFTTVIVSASALPSSISVFCEQASAILSASHIRSLSPLL